MARASNIIAVNRLCWEVECASQIQAERFQKEAGQLMASAIGPRMESVVKELSWKGSFVALDKLEVNVGNIDGATSGREFAVQFEKAFREALVNALRVPAAADVAAHGGSRLENELAALRHFLQTGQLQWASAANGKPIAVIFRRLLNQQAGELIRMLQKAWHRPGIRRRMAWQLPADLLLALLTHPQLPRPQGLQEWMERAGNPASISREQLEMLLLIAAGLPSSVAQDQQRAESFRPTEKAAPPQRQAAISAIHSGWRDLLRKKFPDLRPFLGDPTFQKAIQLWLNKPTPTSEIHLKNYLTAWFLPATAGKLLAALKDAEWPGRGIKTAQKHHKSTSPNFPAEKGKAKPAKPEAPADNAAQPVLQNAAPVLLSFPKDQVKIKAWLTTLARPYRPPFSLPQLLHTKSSPSSQHTTSLADPATRNAPPRKKQPQIQPPSTAAQQELPSSSTEAQATPLLHALRAEYLKPLPGQRNSAHKRKKRPWQSPPFTFSYADTAALTAFVRDYLQRGKSEKKADFMRLLQQPACSLRLIQTLSQTETVHLLTFLFPQAKSFLHALTQWIAANEFPSAKTELIFASTFSILDRPEQPTASEFIAALKSEIQAEAPLTAATAPPPFTEAIRALALDQLLQALADPKVDPATQARLFASLLNRTQSATTQQQQRILKLLQDAHFAQALFRQGADAPWADLLRLLYPQKTSALETAIGSYQAGPGRPAAWGQVLQAMQALHQTPADPLHIPFSNVDPPKEYFIENAGLVLVWPFMKRFFAYREWLTDGAFKDEICQMKGLQALQYMVSGGTEFDEADMVLNKILCGLDLAQTVSFDLLLRAEELASADNLLTNLVRNWGAVGKMSVPGLRQTFLQRTGKLGRSDADWRLLVEAKTHDVLLRKLPWGIGLVRLPWMPQTLHVEWT